MATEVKRGSATEIKGGTVDYAKLYGEKYRTQKAVQQEVLLKQAEQRQAAENIWKSLLSKDDQNSEYANTDNAITKLLNNVPSENKLPLSAASTDLSVIKGKLNRGEGLTVNERYTLAKNISSLSNQDFFDMEAKNSPASKNYMSALKVIADKEKKGVKLSNEENDLKNTIILWNNLKDYRRKSLMISPANTPEQNAQKLNIAEASVKYSKAAYGEEYAPGISVPMSKIANRIQLYTQTGIDQFFTGYEVAGRVASGEKPESIAQKPYSSYEIASSALKEYYTENNQAFQSTVQDVVTNMANNATPMIVGLAIGNSIGGKAGAVAGAIVSPIVFGVSVFGNSYLEAARMGTTDSEGRVLSYAFANTAAEMGLQYLFSGIPGVGGFLSGEIITGISENMSSVIGKAVVKMIGNGAGEFIEESTQSILGPILQKYILEANVETVFSDPISSLSQAGYEGFIGFVSSMLMGGFGNISEASNEARIQQLGSSYLENVRLSNSNVHDIANFLCEVSDKKSDLYKSAKIVLDGNEKALAVGKMIQAAMNVSDKTSVKIYENLGKEIVESENGIEGLLTEYENLSNAENGMIFPDEVEELYQSISEKYNDGETVTDIEVGKFAFKTMLFSPRALMMREMLNSADENIQQESAPEGVENAPFEGVENQGATEQVEQFEGVENQPAEVVEGAEETVSAPNAEETQQVNVPEENKPFVEMASEGIVEPDLTDLSQRKPIIQLAHDLGYKIRFQNNIRNKSGGISNGYIDRKNKVIVLNPNVKKPITWILKHELTHSIERAENYERFTAKLTKSDAFRQWLAEKTGMSADSSIADLQAAYREMVKKSRQDGSLGYTGAQSELVADFVADVMFSGDSARIKSFLSSLGSERQSFIEKVKEFFRKIKNLFTQDGRRLNEIDRLEKVFLQAADDVMKGNVKEETKANTETKNTAEDSRVKYSVETEEKYRDFDNQIKSATDNIGTFDSENADIRYSVDTEQNEDSRNIDDLPFEEVKKMWDNGEIGREEYTRRAGEEYLKRGEEFGTIEKGEKTDTDYRVPKAVKKDGRLTRRTIRTVLETGEVPKNIEEEIGAQILFGNMYSYTPTSNQIDMVYANRVINDGSGEKRWKSAINMPMIDSKTIAIGQQLLMDAIKEKNTAKVLELSAQLAEVMTRAGQVVQANRMIKKMSGVGRLITVQRMVNVLNEDYTYRFGGYFPPIEINETLAEELAAAETPEEIEKVADDLMQSIADQTIPTWIDKWNAWRYTSMLANLLTHVRNFVGNAIFVPTVRIGEAVASIGELTLKQEERTKSLIIKKDYMDFAKADRKSKEVKDLLTESGSKYSDDPKNAIRDKQRIFKTKFLENVRQLTFSALEKEDLIFKNLHYQRALAGYLQARGIDLKTVSDDVLWEARAYAAEKAKKYTFNDASAVASLLQKFTRVDYKKLQEVKGYGGVVAIKMAAEGILPFKRTPINIIKRGVEYSPIGLIKTLTYGTYRVRQGNQTALIKKHGTEDLQGVLDDLNKKMKKAKTQDERIKIGKEIKAIEKTFKGITPSEYIDGLANGVTGLVVAAFGILLANLGLVSGGYDDDDKDDKFKKLNGEQQYSIQIGGHSYSVDWAVPACIPFFIGVEIAQGMQDRDDFQLSKLSDPLFSALEPITSLSMLSGLQNTMDKNKYVDDNRRLAATVESIALNYALQGVPSAFGAVSRIIDSTQRQWYTDKNSALGSFGQEVLNNLENKIPGLSYLQTASVDEWGRIKKRSSSDNKVLGTAERIAENVISPGRYSYYEYDEVNAEIKRIAEKTGMDSVYPSKAAKSITVDGKTKNLTAKEYQEYSILKGEYSFEYIQELLENQNYKKLTDERKAEIISDLYSFANAKAKTKVSDYDLSKISLYKKPYSIEKQGGSVVNYYVSKSLK